METLKQITLTLGGSVLSFYLEEKVEGVKYEQVVHPDTSYNQLSTEGTATQQPRKQLSGSARRRSLAMKAYWKARRAAVSKQKSIAAKSTTKKSR